MKEKNTEPPVKTEKAVKYILTYGLSILIIIVIIAFFYLSGVFTHFLWTPTSASGFEPFQAIAGSWKFNSTGLVMVLKNEAGAELQINRINATYEGIPGVHIYHDEIYGLPFYMGPNQKVDLFFSSDDWVKPVNGTSYSITVNIEYEYIITGDQESTSGTITGLTT